MSVSKSDDMAPFISAIADAVNIRYKGRDYFFESAHVAAMADKWRERLQMALDATGMSMRDISLKAKCSPGYVHGILKDGKEPTIDRLLRVADVLGISKQWLLFGYVLDKETEEIITKLAALSPRERRAFLTLADRGADNDEGRLLPPPSS